MQKSHLSLWQILNMNLGFLGIQFGWGLQVANTSAIYEYLGAEVHQIPLLWLAAPLTGLIVQPIIGIMSDRTWGPLGRRRPYFLVGAILSSVALLWMPNASSLWMAAGLLWILDTSVNISMEPFRAFVADLMPEEQRIQGFAMQSLFVGLGAVIAAALPWVLTHILGIPNFVGGDRAVPLTVQLSYYMGAVIFLSTILWTVITTPEHPPDDLVAFKEEVKAQGGVLGGIQEIWQALKEMPRTMRQLALVKFCTWMAMFCILLYFPPAVAYNTFGAINQGSPMYIAGIQWAGICIATYSAVCLIVSLLLPKITQMISRKLTHTLCLLCGAAGLISLWFIHDNQYLLLLSMVGIGIVWASMLSVPYAILVGALPAERTGVYMGIFNAFVVLPQIIASLGFGWVMSHWLGGDRLLALVIGGGFMLLAALLMQRVEDVTLKNPETSIEIREPLAQEVQTH